MVVCFGTYINMKKSSGYHNTPEVLSSKAKASRLLARLIANSDSFQEYNAINSFGSINITAHTNGMEIIYRKDSDGEWLQINTPDSKFLDRSVTGRVTGASHVSSKGKPDKEIWEIFRRSRAEWQKKYDDLLTELQL